MPIALFADIRTEGFRSLLQLALLLLVFWRGFEGKWQLYPRQFDGYNV